MICRNCGANFPDGSPACPQCGTPADMGAPVYQAPAPAAQGDGSETKIMIFGILGLALSAFMAGLLAWASFAEAASKLKSGSATAILHIRFYPFYYIQGICMLVFMLTLLYDMAYGIAALLNDRYGAEITKDWD